MKKDKRKETTMLENWLDVADVCKHLRISKRTLQEYRLKKILKFTRIRKKVYFKRQDVEELMERNYN